jgi:hypothetical protein
LLLLVGQTEGILFTILSGAAACRTSTAVDLVIKYAKDCKKSVDFN